MFRILEFNLVSNDAEGLFALDVDGLEIEDELGAVHFDEGVL